MFPVDADRFVSLLFGLATGPDLLRLLAIPVFAWAAYRDIQTRRVPNRTWAPLLVVGLIALLWDVWLVSDAAAFEQRLFAVQAVLSLGLVAPLGYVFWRLGGFGGADAKAIITLAVLLPVYPTYFLASGAYPLEAAPLGVFSLTILSNTVLVGLFYPVALAVRNLPRGELTPAMFIGRPVAVDDILIEYGRLLETSDGFTRAGLDIDALRMYLRWRGVSFEAVRENPDRYRHPLPTEQNDPGDGSIAAGESAAADHALPDGGEEIDGGVDGSTPAVRPLDEWGAERFLEEYSAYGTTPRQLREGLETLTADGRNRVWITPGIPFIVPMFVGLLVAFTFGDVLFALMAVLGLA